MAKHEQDGGRDEPQYEGGAIIIEGRIEALEHEQKEERKRDQQYKERQLSFNKWLVIYTGGLLLAAVIANSISIYQSIQSKKAADAAGTSADAAKGSADTAKKVAEDTVTALDLTREQVEAAKRSAKAAEATVRQTYESMRLVERAWLGPGDLSFVKGLTADEKPEVRIAVVNSGRTPAIDVPQNTSVGGAIGNARRSR